MTSVLSVYCMRPRDKKIVITSVDHLTQILREGIAGATFKLEEDEIDDIKALLITSAQSVTLEAYRPDDRAAVASLRRVIEASHRAIADIRHHLGATHSTTALGSNVVNALTELGAYTQRSSRLVDILADAGGSCDGLSDA